MKRFNLNAVEIKGTFSIFLSRCLRRFIVARMQIEIENNFKSVFIGLAAASTVAGKFNAFRLKQKKSYVYLVCCDAVSKCREKSADMHSVSLVARRLTHVHQTHRKRVISTTPCWYKHPTCVINSVACACTPQNEENAPNYYIFYHIIEEVPQDSKHTHTF